MTITEEYPQLDRLTCPAFVVQDDIITQANEAAIALGIPLNGHITPLIQGCAEPYTALESGQLCLSLHVGETTLQAAVERTQQYDIFYLQTQYTDQQLRAFALASQVLRDALSNAMMAANTLSCEEEELPLLKKNLHSLHRTMCNMSDVTGFVNPRAVKLENCDLTDFLDKLIMKTVRCLQQSNYQVCFKNSCPSLICMADREKLERGILNLIANAAKFSCQDDPIQMELHKTKSRLVFSVKNKTVVDPAMLHEHLFDQFRREPGLDPMSAGIGLGMTIVRGAAAAHNGTLLFDIPEAQTIRFTLSIPIRKTNLTELHTPLITPMDYAGGYDHVKTELADVLSAELFD